LRGTFVANADKLRFQFLIERAQRLLLSNRRQTVGYSGPMEL